MRIFEIIDEEINLSIGVLLYFSKEKSFIIELQKNLDEWTAPLLFTSFVKRNIYTIPREESLMWVRERIIPSGRQNIGAILNTHKMKTYDEMKFLELSEGRCSQDSYYIKELDELPSFVIKRIRHNLKECVILKDNRLLCFFVDSTVRIVDMNKLPPSDNLKHLLSNEVLMNSCKLGTGGYCATFNDTIDIPSWQLYKIGSLLPLTSDDFLAYVKRNIVDTASACQELECSRQNLSYLVKQGFASPLKENVKGNLYTKGDIIKNKW